ncbi:MAG: hypothetical protein K1X57_08800 [Gemmataceae bacterium]|nr:hypothetical protein [Gemmataceae bacterium]
MELSRTMRRLIVMLAVMLPLAGCESGGHFSMFGYTTRPNYDPCIKTVYVPIFQNKTFVRGLEFDLTRSVIRTIEEKTPFKVVSDRDKADTELLGTIVAFNKNILNRNQLNEQRETETVLTVAVVWKDMRTGDTLSGPKVSPPPGAVEPGVAPPPPPPVMVTSTASFIPEVGQSITTAKQVNTNKLATQIVALMEKPW